MHKEWARLCIKRLTVLADNKFKKNLPPSYIEQKCTSIRKKIPLYVYLKNGNRSLIYVEPYTSIGDIKKGILRDFKINEKKWKYLGIQEAVEK